MTEQVTDTTPSPKESRFSSKQKITTLGALAIGVAVLGLAINDKLSKRSSTGEENVAPAED